MLLDSPLPQLDRLFDYTIPERWREQALPGVRVLVPLRSAGRQAKGFIVEVVDEVGYEGVLSELDEVVSPARVLDPQVWRLIRRATDRAAGVASDLVRLAVPPRQVRVEKAWLTRRAESPEARDVRNAQRPVAPVITGYAPEAFAEVVRAHDVLSAPGDDRGSAARRIALAAIAAPIEIAPGVWVPASLRTLAELAVATLAAGRSAIVSVPDYRDLDHLAACLGLLVSGDDVARIDATQPAADRYRAFLRTLDDRPVIVVGNRSALLAPAPALGLIAVWDDGDSLHVEQHAPGIHSRDLALLRQEDSGCALVFAAHARSTDVQRLVEVGWLTAVEPSGHWRRRITPTAQQTGGEAAAARARIPSSAWRTVSDALQHGPVLVQVARPGYAPRLACADCGETARCMTCQGPLGVARAGAMASCRWCGALAAAWRCGTCQGERWRTVGRGASRTADELGRAFPGARVVVSDGTTPLQSAPGGRTLVVATRGAEPLVAGGYRAVLLLDGESMLARESLRVVEDCVRWWCNAAALAATDAPVLLVGVGGAVATALATGHPERIAAAELADRRVLRFPPAVRVAALAGTPEAVTRATHALGDLEGVDVLGPTELDDGRVRAIVRLDYARGAEVAARLKAELVRGATARAPRPSGAPPRRRVPALRVRFDDAEPFDDPGGRPVSA
ncbi:primosomal protein N' [Microcella sp.]|uniref:primosomal protein N' family DNA-binding protein n=1 Tax=Microcella sp. TaxID=1913979 RepID=UPI00299F67B2|nr:primosomal protein N' [Microcella sp.]MDX2025204.1 primosomal protein N' [Microcella sp.]